MPELGRWLARESRRQAARPDLLEALLAQRGVAYARHRLGFPTLRTLLRAGLHAIELQLLMAAFVPWSYLAPLIAYRALCSIAGAAHWGALEVLRERVRESMRLRRPASARLEIERWLGLTLWAAAALWIVTLALETGGVLSSATLKLRDAYALACVSRLGADAAVRVLHSGVFALRRVHRPLWSTLAPDLVELCALVTGFGALGVWAIPLATLAGGACDAGLGYVYIRRAYLQRRWQLPSFARAVTGALRGFAWPMLPRAVRCALASVSLSLDGLVLLLLVQAERSGSGAYATLYYVFRPLMAASTHGLRAFYFDLKLIENAGLRAFRPQLVHFLWRLAVVWAVLLSGLTLGIWQLWFEPRAGLEQLVLVAFFVARSMFAVVQLTAFGAGDLARLFWLALAMIAGLLGVRALSLSDFELVFGITLLLAGLVAIAVHTRRDDLGSVRDSAGIFDLATWLARVAHMPQLQLSVLLVNGHSSSAGAVVRGLRAAYPAAAIARYGRRHVLLAHSEPLSERALIVASAGTLSNVWLSPFGAPAPIFEHARRAHALPGGLRSAPALGRSAGGLAQLAREFRDRFPHGELLELGDGRGLRVRPVSAAHLRELVRCVHAHSRGRRTRSERFLPLELAVFAPAGQAKALFVIDRGSAAGFDEFRSRVHRASLYESWPEGFAPVDVSTARDEVQAPIAGVR